MQNKKKFESHIKYRILKKLLLKSFFAMCFVMEKFYVRCYLPHLAQKYIFYNYFY